MWISLMRFGMMDWESMTTSMTMDLFGDTTSERVDATIIQEDDWFVARYMIYGEHLELGLG